MRRRIKRKYTWLPILPTDVGEGVPGASWFHNTVLVDPAQDTAFTQAVEITYDETVTDAGSEGDNTLRDRVEGQEFIIERIVGKVWAAVAQDTTSDNAWRVAIAGFALAVLPTTNTGQQVLQESDFNPLVADNMDKSYMFRRTSTLWNNAQPQNGLLGPTNMQNDGPDYGFVDARSVRRVHRDERIYAIFSVQFMENIGTPTETEWSYGYDLRILGAMRKAKNTSAFK